MNIAFDHRFEFQFGAFKALCLRSQVEVKSKGLPSARIFFCHAMNNQACGSQAKFGFWLGRRGTLPDCLEPKSNTVVYSDFRLIGLKTKKNWVSDQSLGSSLPRGTQHLLLSSSPVRSQRVTWARLCWNLRAVSRMTKGRSRG